MAERRTVGSVAAAVLGVLAAFVAELAASAESVVAESVVAAVE